MNNSALPQRGLELLGSQYFAMHSARVSHVLSRHIWVLELIIKGRLRVRPQAGNWMTLPPNNGILYAPGTRYRERIATDDGACRSIALFFTIDQMPQTAPWQRFSRPWLVISDEEKLLLPLAEQTLSHRSLDESDQMQADAHFLLIMAHLLRARMQENMLVIAANYPQDNIAALANQYMRKHLGDPVRLEDIAASAGMSISGFAHCYKRQTGLSPMVMLRRMRVDAAKSYLMHDRYTLSQIAAETGFADAFHLSRTFKAITGLSPRRFRNTMGASAPIV